jgi:thymidine phosphorylase
MDAELIGRASVALGAGRDRVEDAVDPAVGILVHAKPGAKVSAGETLLDVVYREKARLESALDLITRAIVIDDAPPAPRPLIVGEVR